MVPSRFSQRCRVAGLLSWFLVRVEGRGPGARRVPTRLRTEHNKRRVTDLAWWTGAQSSMIFVKKCGDCQCQDREGWAPVKISCESKLTAPSCDVCRRGWHSFAPLERGSQHDGCVVGERWRAPDQQAQAVATSSRKPRLGFMWRCRCSRPTFQSSLQRQRPQKAPLCSCPDREDSTDVIAGKPSQGTCTTPAMHCRFERSDWDAAMRPRQGIK
jgi:hypothetical protein